MKCIVKERPILFFAPMVCAILEGRKSQTRRVVKLPKDHAWGRDYEGQIVYRPEDICAMTDFAVDELSCPYGQLGDRLWVRETHLPKASGTIYRADFSEFEAAGLGGMYGGWKPSIFCKREYSRILLEITNIRVERLQDISDEDALAEGVSSDMGIRWQSGDDTPRGMFGELWESINGPGSWEANPWVWVIEFKKQHQESGATT